MRGGGRWPCGTVPLVASARENRAQIGPAAAARRASNNNSLPCLSYQQDWSLLAPEPELQLCSRGPEPTWQLGGRKRDARAFMGMLSVGWVLSPASTKLPLSLKDQGDHPKVSAPLLKSKLNLYVHSYGRESSR